MVLPVVLVTVLSKLLSEFYKLHIMDYSNVIWYFKILPSLNGDADIVFISFCTSLSESQNWIKVS